MQVTIQRICGPAEPGVYAVASINLSDERHRITMKGALVLQHVSGSLGVWFPDPQEEDCYGGGSLFELSPELQQVIANSVLDAYEQGLKNKQFTPPQYAQPSRSPLVFYQQESTGTSNTGELRT